MSRIRRIDDLPGVGPVLRERIIAVVGSPGATAGERAVVARINEDPYCLLSVPGIGMHRIIRILGERFGVALPEVMQRMAKENKSVATPLWPVQAAPPTGSKRAKQRKGASAVEAPAVTAASKPKRLPQHWRLEDLPGMGPRLAARVVEWLGASPGEGVPDMTAEEVKTYVKGDPYRLLEVPGVGFNKADRIARDFFGLSPDDERRHEHANAYLLRRNNGVMSLGDYRRRRNEIGVADSSHELLGVGFDAGHVWDEKELRAEQALADWAVAACDPIPGPLRARPERVESEMEGFDLNEEQREACWAGLNLPALALTGGAGTGKTTTVAALASIASRRGLNVHVMAFAGKGSERINEALREFDLEPEVSGPFGDSEDDPNVTYTLYGKVFVSTIHRGLGATGAGHFRLETLAADIVILDEASMLPNTLLAAVLERMRPEARLLLVGDPRQLPPIQYGSPFEALVRLGLPHYELIQNYRQANQEGIFALAEAIRAKRPMPLQDRPGMRVLLGPAFEENLLTAVGEMLAQNPDLDVMSWQCVCALNVTRERVNALFQARLNPDGVSLARYREYRSGEWVHVRKGDKVVVQRNDYEKGIFNGQTGVVVAADREQGALVVRIGEARVLIEYELVSDLLRLGYAITTHKAQGSGFATTLVAEPGVVTLHPNRWAYTSVTRASEKLVIVSELDQAAWWRMVLREPPRQPSTLEQRVQALRRRAVAS